MTDYVLGVDIGTSSTKGVLVDMAGQIVATATRSHVTSTPFPGWAEHDADRVWWSDFASVAAELTAKGQGRIAAVSCSGIGPCTLLTDATGQPLRPAILYGIDTRAEREIKEWSERLGKEVLTRCGSPITSQSVGPKLAWVRRNEPAVWANAGRLMMASSYVVFRLTGEYILDHHSASQAVPLYDLDRQDWIEEWAELVASGVQLPHLAWPGDIVGEVTTAGSRATDIPVGTPVVAGTIDAWAEAFSVGVSQCGDLMISYGTTMFMLEVVERAMPAPDLWLTAGILRGTRTFAAGMATSGALTGWFRELAGEPSYAKLESEAALIPPAADGLILLPYFAGERTPIFDANARGLILGLTLRHGRGHLFRAVLEGVACGARHNLEAIAASAGPPTRVVAVGGGTKIGLWMQIVSDVTGVAQVVPRQTIGACFGGAMLAMLAIESGADVASWNPAAETIKPSETAREVYDELYAIYRSLYPSTATQMHRLAALARQQHEDMSRPLQPADVAGYGSAGQQPGYGGEHA